MANKFDESEKERQEQKKMIEKLRGEVFSLNEKLNCITKQVDRQEQCLLIHGIAKENQENTDALALEISKEKLNIELAQRDLQLVS